MKIFYKKWLDKEFVIKQEGKTDTRPWSRKYSYAL